MKTSTIAPCFFACVAVPVSAATMLPLDATGWNEDVVIGASETVADRTATMDGGNQGATWYGEGFNVGAPDTGLPIGPTDSQASSDLTFSLQPFDANNAVYQGGTLTLDTPQRFLRLAFVGSTGNGTADLTITINFSDSSSPEVFSGLSGTSINSDWFFNSPAAYIADGRVNVDSGDTDNVNNDQPRLYENVFELSNTTSAVESVDIANNGGGFNAVMAISGEVVPEPSTALLAALGGLGLLRRRRR